MRAPKRILWALMAGSLSIFGVDSCYNREAAETARKARERAEEKKELTALLNAATMVEEVDRRLREKIKLLPGVIIVSDDYAYASFAMPVTTPWSVECGPSSGLKINFGDITSDSELSVSLYMGSIDAADCNALIAATAGRFRAYVRGVPQPSEN